MGRPRNLCVKSVYETCSKPTPEHLWRSQVGILKSMRRFLDPGAASTFKWVPTSAFPTQILTIPQKTTLHRGAFASAASHGSCAAAFPPPARSPRSTWRREWRTAPQVTATLAATNAHTPENMGSTTAHGFKVNMLRGCLTKTIGSISKRLIN